MAINFNRDNTGIFSVNDAFDNSNDQIAFLGFGKSDEEKALEKIQELREQQNKITGGMQGDVLEELKEINPSKYNQIQELEKEIENLQQQFPEDTTIQEASLTNEFGFPLTAQRSAGSYGYPTTTMSDVQMLQNTFAPSASQVGRSNIDIAAPMSLRNFAPFPGLQSTGVAPFPGLQRTGIIQQAPSNFTGAPFTDDAGITIDAYDEFPQQEKKSKGIGSLFEFLSRFSPVRGIAKLLEPLNARIQSTDFAKSSNFAEYLQRRRDRKAREQAAIRGAEKQKMKDRREFDQNFKGLFSGQGQGDGPQGDAFGGDRGVGQDAGTSGGTGGRRGGAGKFR